MATQLSSAQVAEDLASLGRTLDERFSYRTWNGTDAAALLGVLAGRLSGGASRRELGEGVLRLLTRFGDGHSRIHDPDDYLLRGYLPVRLGPVGDRLVACAPDHHALACPGRPYLEAIDGEPVARWRSAASGLIAQGSPQWIQMRTARWLAYVAQLREDLGLPARDDVTLTLAGEGGATTVTLPLSAERLTYQPMPDHESCHLDDVGYLRIDRMSSDEAFLAERRAELAAMRGAAGLIVDVRGNGGGDRDMLKLLLSFLMRPGDAPHVCNVAAYRLGPEDAPDDPGGYMDNRSLYPLTWDGWTDAERGAIARCRETFTPSWPLPEGFSDWHYFVVSPSDTAPHTLDCPVVVLIDAGCYSATDVFVGALAGRPGVTLMGEATAGGSGRSNTFGLPHSGVSYQLSSMASYRPCGALYEGAGVAPDVVVPKTPADWIAGPPDAGIAAALASLRS